MDDVIKEDMAGLAMNSGILQRANLANYVSDYKLGPNQEYIRQGYIDDGGDKPSKFVDQMK